MLAAYKYQNMAIICGYTKNTQALWVDIIDFDPDSNLERTWTGSLLAAQGACCAPKRMETTSSKASLPDMRQDARKTKLF